MPSALKIRQGQRSQIHQLSHRAAFSRHNFRPAIIANGGRAELQRCASRKQVWYLSSFSNMEFNPYYDQERPVQSPIQSWALVMTEQRLLDKDREALAEKQRAVAPTPKF
jgi:hypothetical protein